MEQEGLNWSGGEESKLEEEIWGGIYNTKDLSKMSYENQLDSGDAHF